MRRLADRGETITQEFFIGAVPDGALVASIAGDPIFAVKHLIGSRDGPRQEFTEEELREFPPLLREEARRNGFREDIEFGRVGASVPLPVRGGDRVRGLIECVVPPTQPVGTLFATLSVHGLGADPIDVPFALTVGEVGIELLTTPVVARRGQSVQVAVQVTFPPGTPAADLSFELRGEHCRIDPPQIVSVPEGGSVVGSLTLVADRDAPLGLLPDCSMRVTGFDGPGLEDSVVFEITVEEPPVTLQGLAEEAINAKWHSLGGSPGPPVRLGPEGLIEVPNGFHRDYALGSIYRRNEGQAFFLGLATAQRYDQLGGPGGFLGFPVSDFEGDPREPGSGVTRFENGAIYFWPDVGALEMREISLRYVGFHCFGETNEFSGSDEPYFLFGVVPTVVEERETLRTRVYDDVDAGRSVGDVVELYRGLPMGAAISITLAEHDEGDPDKYRDNVERAVDTAADKVVEGLAAVPVLGVFLAVLAEVVLVIAAPAITDAVNDLLGTEDDHIGTVALAVTPKDMMRLTRTGRQDFNGVQAHLESPLISGGGSSYKAYFDVEG